MRAQMTGLHPDDVLCWYGRSDGLVEVKVSDNRNWSGTYLFVWDGSRWLLHDFDELVIVE